MCSKKGQRLKRELQFQVSMAKSLLRPYLSEKKLSMAACTCLPSDSSEHKTGASGQKARPYLQNNQCRKGLEALLKQ
jgi:hypothetical protein